MQQYQSEKVNELAKALLSVQRILQPAVKDATNPFVKNKYASLNSVMEVCKEPLLSHGIWLCQYPVPVENTANTGTNLGLVTKLTHAESGQWQSSLAVIPLPKADPQGMGSAITYARRYALCAMLGIVTEDDDGQGATLGTKPAQKRATSSRQATNTQQTNEAYYSNTQVKNSQTEPSNPTSRQTSQQSSQQTSQHIPQTLNSLSSPTSHQENLTSLPRIDGISYQQITTSDGRPCIVATGNTQAKKELLKGAGFQWNPQRKMWWRYADTA